jgi:fructokinase
LHVCGSTLALSDDWRTVALRAARLARERGARVSFDPNVRLHLWRDPAELCALCEEVFPLCSVVKLSEDELLPTLGVATPEAALDRLSEVELVCVTLGARGVLARRRGETLHVPAPKVDVVDTTGAGDGFVAGLLASDPLQGDLRTALTIACAAGSRVCTKLGAVAGLPRRGEL